LPQDVDALLNIVAGEGRAIADAVRTTGLAERAVSDAAGFYIEQILLHPDADCYRALGARSDATIDQLRRNMALLLRWLHPDRETNSARAIYAGRITDAWNNIKTADRRSAYDTARKISAGMKPSHRAPGHSSSSAVGAGHGHAANGQARQPAPLAAGTGRRRGRTKRRGRLWRILGRLLGQGRT
jgi:curved DNA-binding protein CbpA